MAAVAGVFPSPGLFQAVRAHGTTHADLQSHATPSALGHVKTTWKPAVHSSRASGAAAIVCGAAVQCAARLRRRMRLRAGKAAEPGTVMELFSPAKINLFLRIIRKRPDGYHDLASLFHTVGFGDKLTMEVLPETATKDELTCNLPNVPVDESNLVIRALNLFRDRSGIKTFFKLDLQKSMPAEAGLGGGSSNGATAFWGANALAGFPASGEELLKWADDPVVGSDATFFLSEGTAYCTGRGEIVTPVDPLPVPEGTPLYLVKPTYGCSTGQIFKALDYDGLSKNEPDELLSAFTKSGFNHKLWVNDLEPPAFQVVPDLGKLKDFLARDEFGFQAVLMSGSGSTLFCIGEPACGEEELRSKVEAEFETEGIWQAKLMRREGEKEWYKAAISAMASTVAAIMMQCSGASAAQVTDQVTGFAEYAEKGGAMEVNPACFVTDCGKQTKECFVEDARCLKGALCLSRCRGAQDCATQCFAEYGCKRLDAWLNCTVETKQCVSTPPQLIDVSKWFSENLPKKIPNFDPAQWQGTWYKVRGYNPKYDCFSCQTNSFDYKAGSSTMSVDVQLRLPRLKSGGFWQNSLEEKLNISAEAAPSTFDARGQIFGLTFDEDWYVLGGDKDFWLVAYKGKSLQDTYEGCFVYARTPDISGEVEAKAKKLAEANGYVWSKFCVIDNSCPSAPAGQGSSDVAATLDWDDIPDLIEWFAPGTVAKKAEFTGRYD